MDTSHSGRTHHVGTRRRRPLGHLGRTGRTLALVLGSLGLGAELTAQTADLPLRLDLVRASGSAGAGYFDGPLDGGVPVYEHDAPGVATGYVGMPPSQSLDVDSPGAGPYYGWLDDYEPQSMFSRFFPSDITPQQILDTLLAADTEPAVGMHVLPIGDLHDDYEDLYDLLAEGHSIHSVPRTFGALVPSGTSHVLMRVVLGRVAQEDPATRVDIPIQTGGCDGTISYDDSVISEEFPYDAYWEDGLWTRTHVAKADLTPNVSAGGWRSIWIEADTICEDSVERIELQFTGEYLPPTVRAIEVYEYQAADQPPVSFDVESPDDPFVMNASYAHWIDDDAAEFELGIDALAAGDLATAITKFTALEDDVAQAVGYLWMVGWLGDDRPLFATDGVEWEYLQDAITLLEAVNLATDTRAGFVAHYLDMAKQYRRALVHELFGSLPSVEMPDGTTYTNILFDVDLLIPSTQVMLTNLNQAEARWRDVGNQTMGPVLDNDTRPLNPLFFKAMVYAGINTWTRHTKNTNVDTSNDSYYWVKQHFDLGRDFLDTGLYSLDSMNPGAFDAHDSLAILVHLATWDTGTDDIPDYDEDDVGGITSNWGGEGSDDVHGVGADNWWHDLPLMDAAIDVDVGTGTCSDNVWSRQLLRYQLAQGAAYQWWSGIGAEYGQFGGGDGDDAELFLQLLYPTFPFPGEAPLVEQALSAVGTGLLERWGENGTGEYFFGNDMTGAADVEHSAEFTSNVLLTLMQADYGEPYFLEYGLQAAQYLDDDVWSMGGAQAGGEPWTVTLGEPSPFGSGGSAPLRHDDPDDTSMTPAPIAYRMFQAWWIDAEGADLNHPGDTPLNGRALQQNFGIAAYNGHEATVARLREWAEWWWVVCMDDGTLAGAGSPPSGGQAKPRGIPPALVQYDDTSPPVYLEYGENGNWWEGAYGGGLNNGAIGSSAYMYSAFLWRYLDPEPTSDRASYLNPMYYAAEMLGEYWRLNLANSGPLWGTQIVDLGSSGAGEGSPYWVASRLNQHRGFKQLLLEYMPYLEAETGIDRNANHDELIEFLKAGLGCVEPSTYSGPNWATERISCEPLGKLRYHDNGASGDDDDKDELVDSLQGGFDWLHAFFPLATKWVSYTDRAFISPSPNANNARQDAFASTTGSYVSQAFPSRAVTWERADPDDEPLNIAAVVEGDRGDGVWRVSLLNFETGNGTETRTIRMRLAQGFEPGDYDVYYGDNDGDDTLGLDPMMLPTPDDTVTVVRYGANAYVDLDIVLGTSDCGVETIVELWLDTPDSSTPSERADPALSAYAFDLVHVEDGGLDKVQFQIDVHNVGTADLTNSIDPTIDVWLYAGSEGGAPGEPAEVPDDSFFTYLGQLEANAITSLAGWSPSAYTPATPVTLSGDDLVPVTWGWGSNRVWVRATAEITAHASDDPLHNNRVTKVFYLDPPD